MKLYGLIGYPLGHSFSRKFFTQKFAAENIDATYQLFPLENPDMFPALLSDNSNLCGLNVTIPYKEKIIPFLHELDVTAKAIGAVNVIRFIRNGKELYLKGYNSDVIGFEKSLKPLLKPYHNKALILGTGGAAKGVAYVLNSLGIAYKYVSRTGTNSDTILYTDITPDMFREFTLIINATPTGTFPHVDECPRLPYEAATEKHLFYDLIYNPEKTLFLQQAEKQNAVIKNGLEMLHEQALAAWNIWNM